jgi:hypothetical protein
MVPKPNYFLLKRLIEHLERITDFEETNHMYATNLAIVFGPSLLRPPPKAWYERRDKAGNELDASKGSLNEKDEDKIAESVSASANDIASSMQHLGQCSTIVKNMILQYHWLFDVEREVDHTETFLVEEVTTNHDEESKQAIDDPHSLAIEGQDYIEEVLEEVPPVWLEAPTYKTAQTLVDRSSAEIDGAHAAICKDSTDELDQISENDQ